MLQLGHDDSITLLVPRNVLTRCECFNKMSNILTELNGLMYSSRNSKENTVLF